MNVLINAENVRKEYSDRGQNVVALDEFSLHVGVRESVAILGPSGCGKTTVLKILAGILEPTGGRIEVGGQAAAAFRSTSGVGYVPQAPVLFPWRTVRDNVLLPSEIGRSGNGKREARDRADRLLKLVGLGGFEGSHPKSLSGGMRQRAALVRALLLHPRLLLLDEPFSALDEMTREQLWVEWRGLWSDERPTTVIVTHSVREAVFFGDRVVVMSPRPGRTIATLDIQFDVGRNVSLLMSREFDVECQRVRDTLFQ